ncbi:MAG TPA: hypothetical protein VF144_19135 [Chitinophagaceae bacterium]
MAKRNKILVKFNVLKKGKTPKEAYDSLDEKTIDVLSSFADAVHENLENQRCQYHPNGGKIISIVYDADTTELSIYIYVCCSKFSPIIEKGLSGSAVPITVAALGELGLPEQN